MSVISSAELTKMRAIADDFLPDTCTIQTRTTTVDVLGGITETYTSTYTGVACRLDPGATSAGFGGESIVNAAVEGEAKWMLNIPYDQAITITGRVIHDSKTYEVKAVMDTHSYATIRRAVLVRVNSGA